MTPATPPDPPGRLRCDAEIIAKPVWRLAWQVVHRAAAAVVLATRDAPWLVVTAPQRWLVPGGCQICSTAVWEQWLAATGPTGSPVDLADWADAAVTPVCLRVPPLSADAVTCRRTATELRAWAWQTPVGRRAGGRARVLRRAARALSAPPRVEVAADTLIGAGPGTTPTGDDVLAGYLNGLFATGRLVTARRMATRLATRLAETTAASRHELLAASRGQAPEHVLALLAAVATPGAGAWRTALERMDHWGSTSGRDLAFGLALAIGAPGLGNEAP